MRIPLGRAKCAIVIGSAWLAIGVIIVTCEGSHRASAESPYMQRVRPGRRAAPCDWNDGVESETIGGSWYWVRSPEEEKRVVMGLFNRYCIRCHGVDGRGVWDIPDVPNFTNARWQASRVDGQLARAIMEGRGSVMPPWRGALSLEEAWALARHVRTFVPGNEVLRPDTYMPDKPATVPMPPPQSPMKK
jgi:hypothetical protein